MSCVYSMGGLATCFESDTLFSAPAHAVEVQCAVLSSSMCFICSNYVKTGLTNAQPRDCRLSKHGREFVLVAIAAFEVSRLQ